MPKIVFLWTDIALWLMVLGALAYVWHVRRSPNLRATWGRVARDTPAMCSAVILAAFTVVGLLDSVHYRPQLPPAPGAAPGRRRLRSRLLRHRRCPPPRRLRPARGGVCKKADGASDYGCGRAAHPPWKRGGASGRMAER